MNAIAELHKQIDEMDRQLAESSAKNGKPITCKGKGCFACCYEPVYCSDAEVKHMLELVPERHRELVTSRTRDAIETVRSTGMLFKKDMPPVMEWKAMKLPCPLLANGQCMVYANRPVSCRSHMAVGPAEWCETNRTEQKYPMAAEHRRAQGHAIIAAHMKLGNIIIYDNMLALLENELLGQYHPTASAQQINIEQKGQK